MANHRAEIEIQFNWIFVLIAGGMILFFFFSIIKWGKKSSDESSAITLSKYLDSIYTSAAIKEQTVNKVEIPFEKIEFTKIHDITCDGFIVDDSEKKQQIRNKIILAPSMLKEGQLITWSLSWDVPFRVTNLLFVSSPKVRYIFIGDVNDNIFNYLQKSFPEEFNAEFLDSNALVSSNIKDHNDDKVRFIYINPPNYPSNFDTKPSYLQEFRKMRAEDVTALVISAASLDGIGNINFYIKTKPEIVTLTKFNQLMPQTNFFGRASLFAAIFSESPEFYLCNMKKAFRRMSDVAEIYKARTADLYSYYSNQGNYNCQVALDSSIFNSMILAGQSLSGTIDSNNFNQLAVSASQIKSQNTMAQQYSCALLY